MAEAARQRGFTWDDYRTWPGSERWELIGGEAYSMSRDYVIAAQRNDVDVELKAYMNEGQAAEDYRTGKCDALLATAFRTRPRS